MSTWTSLNAGTYPGANLLSQKAQAMFIAQYAAGNTDPKVVVMARLDKRTGEETLYFSPSAHAIGAALGATPCEKPIRDRTLCVVVGDARAVELNDLS